MIHFLANLALALGFALLVGPVTAEGLALGFILGFLLLYASQLVFGRARYFSRVGQVLAFVLFYVAELVMANVRVAVDVVTPRLRARPGVVAIPLDARTDAEITLLASLITMTPGSLTIDVSSDRRVIYVHAMYVDDAERFRRRLKESLERRVLEMLR